jgi:hypothetical protein
MFAALCQSADARDKRRAIPVCSGFAFHVLMILDETGVLRVHRRPERSAARRG